MKDGLKGDYSITTESGIWFFVLVGEDWYAYRGYGGQTITVFPKQEKIVVTQATVTNRPLNHYDLTFEVALEKEKPEHFSSMFR